MKRIAFSKSRWKAAEEEEEEEEEQQQQQQQQQLAQHGRGTAWAWHSVFCVNRP
jgi:hypothetical protein